ncbi:MAG: alanine--tRNA ligase [Parcubacteria group bacterium]|nr:alanine--tRNA ligase [Parcubacteria group bacterium]
MTSEEIRKRFLEFFKKRDHAIIPSASLVPENDPTTLFTGSGMQPLLPYLLGEKHPKGTKIANSQKSFRAEDIEEIGDNRHTTFFEMLGNWSFGNYFKKEQLSWFFEFLVDEVGLSPEHLYVTAFIGDKQAGVAKDTESAGIWKQLFKEKGIVAKEVEIGSESDGYKKGMQGGRIFFYDDKKNWWNRGKPSLETTPIGDPAGPDSEVFYDFRTPHNEKFGKECNPNCDCGRFMEIGNSVFMEYKKEQDGSFTPLKQKNVDFGGGLERIAAAANNNPDIFFVDTLSSVVKELEILSGKSYKDEKLQRAFRIVADHMRAAIFMIIDGVRPSNTEQGYILRRLIRRSLYYADTLSVPKEKLVLSIQKLGDLYSDQYPEIRSSYSNIAEIILEEKARFRKTLTVGLKEFEKITGNIVSGKDAFILFSTYGFPIEMTQEIAREKNIKIDISEFNKEMERHQEISRAGAEKKFKGGLADTSEKTTMLHTTTHLMLAGLRKFLGDHVHQAGSNITPERTRFDFNHPEKVGRDILDKVEDYVNEAISKKCDVTIEQTQKEEARKKGVEGSFWERYPDMVNVYMVKCSDGTIYSQELCGGPHVKNTQDIKGVFKIKKEEAISAGTRRIKAVLVLPH